MTTDPKSTTSSKKSAENGVGDSTRIAKEHSIDSSSDIFDVREPTFAQIGRYKILSQLGRGGFGMVFRAFDPELNCQVAIKIPRPDRIVHPGELERFRNEARTLARIRNHPSIVTVYDVGQTEDGITFAVMEFVEGEPLSRFIESHELTIDESLQILSRIAEALTAAHKASIVHRDLKPSNVILDKNRHITLVDFGLALHDDLTLADLGDVIEGTPRYMAPEQLRGENHRIDGQTDIWGFGVIMYRMLTGKHPYRGKDTREIARAIRYKDARPLRQLNPEVSREIERICLKCLSKNMSDRYLSVPDLMEDLTSAIEEMQSPRPSGLVTASQALQQNFPEPEHSHELPDSQRSSPSGHTGPSANTDNTENPLQITYKGLRPFDSNDSSFFMQLLPGPQTRDGIPESIQFWRSRILGDELEPLDVGLIYGPSGCGKSSFVRAGLLPVLPAHVNPVYLECSSENTERRLAQQIAHRIDSVNGGDSLPDILRQIRRGLHLDPEDKLLIVLDQFEQWLHGNADYGVHELTEALRQCDGDKISCILLIRDDFWMSTSEFMKCLDIPIREGHNALALPLFDERHARKVLVAYGRSFDRLAPSADASGASLNAQQSRFVRDAVKSLAQNGKVICVHLSVFAQIAKDRQWTGSELQRLGGLKGVGVRFLDDLFPAQSSSKFRTEQDEIVKSIFRELLPGNKTVIKGTSRTRDELWQRLDGKHSRQAFDQVLERLESELRLISLVDEDNHDEHTAETSISKVDSYRLTHDFLVGPIREWLDRKQKETWRGRAAIRLEELGERWAETNDKRFIPMPLEYLQAVAGIDKSRLGFNAAQVLRRAHRHYAIWGALIFTTLLLTGGTFWWKLNQSADRTAAAVYETFLEADPAAVIPYADRIRQYRSKIARLINRHDVSEATAQVTLRRAMAAIICGMTSVEFQDTIASQFPDMVDEDVFNVQYLLRDSPARSQFIETCRQTLSMSTSNLEKSRIATVNASLGDFECLDEVTAVDQDQTDRTLLICNFDKLVSDKTLPIHILKSSKNPEVQSAMLALIALQDHSVYESERENLHVFIDELYENSLDSGMHSSVEALAKKFGWRLANPLPPPNACWNTVPEIGWTLVKIPAGELEENSGVPNDSENGQTSSEARQIDAFWICDREITNREFYEFLHDESYPGPRPDLSFFEHVSRDEKPVLGVALNDAKMFCNWASWKTGRKPVYLWADEKVTKDVTANGFRVPDFVELEYACRCGGVSALHIGDLAVNALLPHFENKYMGGLDKPDFEHQDVAQKLPNPWGLFDTLGGAAELCVDPQNDDRPYCRGFFYDCFAADREILFIPGRDNRRSDVGIRLAVE